jgi:hypothetical protein
VARSGSAQPASVAPPVAVAAAPSATARSAPAAAAIPASVASPAASPATASAGAAAAPAAAASSPLDSGPAAPSQVQLRLTSNPAGAAVTLDGQALGHTPLAVALPRSSATRRIEVRHPGYQAASREVVLDIDSQLDFALRHKERRPRPRSDAPAGDLGIKEGR